MAHRSRTRFSRGTKDVRKKVRRADCSNRLSDAFLPLRPLCAVRRPILATLLTAGMASCVERNRPNKFLSSSQAPFFADITASRCDGVWVSSISRATVHALVSRRRRPSHESGADTLRSRRQRAVGRTFLIPANCISRLHAVEAGGQTATHTIERFRSQGTSPLLHGMPQRKEFR